MISYFRIYLLFLIPSYIALTCGFFYSYKQHHDKTLKDFEEKYHKVAENYSLQTAELDRSYERLMEIALLGIKNEVNAGDISTVQLKKIATKYNVSHLFLIDEKGYFF